MILFSRYIAIFKIKIFRIFCRGVVYYSNDDLEKNKIQLLSAIALLLNVLNFITVICYIILGFYWQLTIVVIWGLLIYFLSLLLKKKGYFVFSSYWGFQSTIVFIFVGSAIHGYQTVFNHFYLIFVVTIPFVFSDKNYRQIYFLILQSVVLFFVQNMYGKTYLINFHLLPKVQENIYNTLMLSIMIVFIFGLTYFNILMNQLHENKLKKIQRKLSATEKRLITQNNELQTFGLSATHSLKTPLFIINSFLNKIKENIKTHEHKTSNGYYIDLIKQCNNLNEKYSDDLIKYTSIYNVIGHFAKIDLGQFIQDKTSIFLLKYKNAEIITDIKGVTIYTNPLLLEIIIQNLVDNALKYNLSEFPTVQVFTQQKDQVLSVYFQDNGIGIATEYVDKLFDPFNRINEMETAMGSGLGLSITKLAAIKMNADITLVSGEGGCVFRLSIAY